MIQGITGKEGMRALEWMSRLDAPVIAGVTPGKGGQTISGITNRAGEQLPEIPVYSTVSEALEAHPEINASAIYVPPKFVLSAAQEAISAQIPLIHIIAEGVPTKDTAVLLELAAQQTQAGNSVRIVGPSSIGLMSVGKSVMGSMGAGRDDAVLAPFDQAVTVGKELGGVVVLSKSGGMALTVAQMLAQNGVALSTIVGLGGDKLIGTTYADLLPEIAQDSETWAVVVVGEIGGSYEEDLATAITKSKFEKPVVAFISGRFAEHLPTGVSFGHAGAIVSKTIGTRVGKVLALEEAGALIADNPEDIVDLLKKSLE